jgi:tetratricopeptide (TPR) repeat protein
MKDDEIGEFEIDEEEFRVAAERLFAIGVQLMIQGTEESSRTALVHFERASLLFQVLVDQNRLVLTLSHIGRVHLHICEYQKSYDYFMGALSLGQDIIGPADKAGIINHLAQVYYAVGKIQDAIECFYYALSLHRSANDREGEAAALNNIGFIHSAVGQHQQAIQYCEQALEIAILRTY